MYPANYRVVVVEDEPKIRRNLVQKIEALEDGTFQIVGTASNGEEGLAMIKSLQPDVIFTDIKMPKMDGIDLIKQVKIAFPEVLIVILSGYNEFDYVKFSMKMGVHDYLLKPISQEELGNILQSLSLSMQQKDMTLNRILLTSTVSGKPIDISDPSRLLEQFMMFLICSGNLSFPIMPPQQTEFFQSLWSSISFDEVLGNNRLDEGEYWFLIDEKASNQKILLISVRDRGAQQIEQLAAEIHSALKPAMKQLPLTISYYSSIVKRADIQEKAQQLRILLDRELVIGKSALLPSTVHNHVKTTTATSILVDQVFQNKLNTYIQSGEVNLLKQVLADLFSVWVTNDFSQRLLEKTMAHIVRLVYLQTGKLSETELYSLEYELYARNVVETDPENFLHNAGLLIDKLTKRNDDSDSMDQAMTQILTYIEMNYVLDINLEQLALNYYMTSSTFSKLFKKNYGETPLKYIIKLRIEEAKRLMLENPQQEVWKIAEIVGYEDQHYFSRIFKNTTGVSPSEFRKIKQ